MHNSLCHEDIHFRRFLRFRQLSAPFYSLSLSLSSDEILTTIYRLHPSPQQAVPLWNTNKSCVKREKNPEQAEKEQGKQICLVLSSRTDGSNKPSWKILHGQVWTFELQSLNPYLTHPKDSGGYPLSRPVGTGDARNVPFWDTTTRIQDVRGHEFNNARSKGPQRRIRATGGKKGGGGDRKARVRRTLLFGSRRKRTLNRTACKRRGIFFQLFFKFSGKLIQSYLFTKSRFPSPPFSHMHRDSYWVEEGFLFLLSNPEKKKSFPDLSVHYHCPRFFSPPVQS